MVKKRKKSKKVKKAKKIDEPYASMDEDNRLLARDIYRREQLNRKIKRDNYILWGLGIFVLIYLFFQI